MALQSRIKKMPNRIDPHTLYETSELENLLRGFVNLDTLRKYGLRALPGKGYWGQSVIDAMNQVCETPSAQRSGVSRGKETHNAIFDNGEGDRSDDRLIRSRTSGQQIQSQRPRRSTRPRVHTSGDNSGQVESQRQKLQRLVYKEQVPSDGTARSS